MGHSRSAAARPIPGARGVWGAAALAAALSAAPAAGWEREAGALPWQVGGVSGFTVDAVTVPDSAGLRLEVVVRIRPATLVEVAAGRTHTGPIEVEARLRAGRRGAEQRLARTVAGGAADTASGLGHVLRLPFRVTPGPHRLHVRIETRRRTLPGRGEGRPESGEVAGEIAVPAPQAGRQLSDLRFLWPDPGTSAAALVRDGRRLIPNPERLYGRLAPHPLAALTAHAPGPPRPWRWVARIENAAGEAVAVREGSAAAGAWLETLAGFEGETLAAGGYTLEAKAWQEGDSGAVARRAAFSVGWEPDTWLRDPLELEDEVHFLLRRDEEDRFKKLSPGAQERMIAEYWRDRDPSPGTPANERRDLFLERVRFANQTYGRYGLGRGMFSDMGRVFIRYGEPNEVHRSVIPGGNDPELLAILHRYVGTDDRPTGNLGDPAVGADMRPFEVWIYEGEIMQPFDTDRAVEQRRRLAKPLVFLFIDEQWLGDYRLRYSTE